MTTIHSFLAFTRIWSSVLVDRDRCLLWLVRIKLLKSDWGAHLLFVRGGQIFLWLVLRRNKTSSWRNSMSVSVALLAPSIRFCNRWTIVLIENLCSSGYMHQFVRLINHMAPIWLCFRISLVDQACRHILRSLVPQFTSIVLVLTLFDHWVKWSDS